MRRTMGRIEENYAKELLLQGLSRPEIRKRMREKFRCNYNIITISLSKAAREMEEEKNAENESSESAEKASERN